LFRDAKVSTVEYDPLTDDLATVSIHNLEDESLTKGRSTSPDYEPMLRVDPTRKCAVLLAYRHFLAVMPLRQQGDSEEAVQANGESSEKAAAENGGESVQVAQTKGKSIFREPYWVDLSEFGIQEIRDISFVEGSANPTLTILFSRKATWCGRLNHIPPGQCTCAAVSYSLDMDGNVKQPVSVAQVEDLPYNSFRLVPIKAPLGGHLILSSDVLLYFNTTILHALGLNRHAALAVTHNCELIEHSFETGSGVMIDGACAQVLDLIHVVISERSGDLHLISLRVEGDTVEGMMMEVVGKSSPASAMCLLEQRWLFLGARETDSVLMEVSLLGKEEAEEPEGGVEPGLEGSEEGLFEDDKTAAGSQAVSAEQGPAPKKRKTIDLLDEFEAMFGDGEEEEEEQGTKTTLKGTGELSLVQKDRLFGTGPIGSITAGVHPQAKDVQGFARGLEAVGAVGKEKSGGVAVIHGCVHPDVITEWPLDDVCMAVWAVGSGVSMDGYHTHLVISQEPPPPDQ